MMEDGGSPTRKQQPLLPDDESIRGPRMGAYRPPPTAMASEPHDLHLTADGGDGMINGSAMMTNDFSSPPHTVVAPPTAFPTSVDGEIEYQLPPLISYCSYVRYGCAFGRWILLIVIGNIVAYGICVKGHYFDHYGYYGYGEVWPFDSWRGAMLAAVWFVTSIWLYLSAKVIDRDVEYVDTTAQYQLGSLQENNNDGIHNVGSAGAGTAPVLNFTHVYGQVSRRLDSFFHTKSGSATTSSSSPPPPEGTSSLVNLSFALWAIMLGGAVYLGTGTGMGMIYADDICDPRNLPNATDGKFTGRDYQDIANFPEAVQTWIADFDSGRYYGTYLDDLVYDDMFVPQSEFSFPTSFTSDYGVVAAMTGGETTFYAAKPPPIKTGDDPVDGATTPTFSDVKKMVLVESNNGGTKYYKDIVNPRMFLPIENTISADANGNRVATQYCFSSAKDPAEKKKAKQRSWDNVIRTTNIHCIVKAKGSTTKFEILNATIAWKDKSYSSPELRAASSGGILLVAHMGNDNTNMYQEVVSVNPSNGMEKKSVFHLTKSQMAYWDDFGSGADLTNSRCVQDRVQPYAIFAALGVMVLSGLWLILREGVAAGVVPFMFCTVAIIRATTGEYAMGVGHLCLTAGTLFFHFVLCCGSDGIMRNVCQLPNWIGRDMYIWSLYSWILSFFFMDLLFRMGDMMFWSLGLLLLSGIILDHPVGQLMGYISVSSGILWLMLWPFFGRYGGGIVVGIMCIIVGFGMIGVANFFAGNRRLCAAVCRPCSRAGSTMMYGSPNATVPTAAISTV